jgi:hypothetical protein
MVLHAMLCRLGNEVYHAAHKLRDPWQPEQDRDSVLALREHMAQAIEKADRFLDRYTPPPLPKSSVGGPTLAQVREAARLKRMAGKSRVVG